MSLDGGVISGQADNSNHGAGGGMATEPDSELRKGADSSLEGRILRGQAGD